MQPELNQNLPLLENFSGPKNIQWNWTSNKQRLFKVVDNGNVKQGNLAENSVHEFPPILCFLEELG
jgi:hypothetical protein